MFSLGFSPCPNDTFMFHALVNSKIDLEEFEFDVVMEDVESLNQRALQGNLDITKISFAALTKVTDQYELLDSGSALGRGVGPLVISNGKWETANDRNNFKSSVAIPGILTTANFLFSLSFPQNKNKREILFSEIEDAVLNGDVDAGVIIHENRFTYEKKGLQKICDLGELWEKETGCPIPLGGIVIKKNLPADVKQRIGLIIKRSIEYAFDNPYASREYVKEHAQEMDDEVIRKHIETYVNNFSVDLGEEGRRAIDVLFNKAIETGWIQKSEVINPKFEILK